MTKYNKNNELGNDFRSLTQKIDARIESFEKGTPEPTDLRLTDEHLDQFLAAIISRDNSKFIDKDLIDNIEKILRIQDRRVYNRNLNVQNKLDLILELITYMRTVQTSYRWSRETFLQKIISRYGNTAKYKELIEQLTSDDYIMDKELAIDCRDTVKDAMTIFQDTYIDGILKEAFQYKLSGDFTNSDEMGKVLTYVLMRAADFRKRIENVSRVEMDDGLLITNDMAEGVIRKVMHKLKENSVPVKTGLKEMNMMIDGFYKRKLYMFGGVPNTGKTTTLGQFTIDCRKYNRAQDLLINKKKRAVAVYITMEDSMEDIANRAVGFMGSQQLRPNESTIEQLTESFRQAHINEDLDIDLLIQEFPGKMATVDDIISYLSRMETKLECEYVMISIDYVKRIKCKNTRINDEFLQLAEITEDLRNMAIKFNCPVVTAAQLNRVAQQKITDDINRKKSDTVLQLSSAEIGNSFAMVENTDMLVLINSEFGQESGQKYMSFKKVKMRYRPQHEVDYFAAVINPMGGFESDFNIPTNTYNRKDINYRKQFSTVESIKSAELLYLKNRAMTDPNYSRDPMMDFNMMQTTELSFGGPVTAPEPNYDHNNIETAIPLNTIK